MLYPTPTDYGNVCITSTFPAVELRQIPYSRPEGLPAIRNTRAAIDFLADWLAGCTVEHMVLLCLDKGYKPICYSPVGKGTPVRADFPISDVLRTCLLARSDRCMLIHNHPSGVAQPSQQDVKAARLLHASLWDCGILLLDFGIVAGDDAIDLTDDDDNDEHTRDIYSMFDARIGPYANVGRDGRVINT